MPKDPARNRDRYAIRGGQLNEFDFNRQHGEMTQQENAQGQGLQGADDTSGLPPDQAKAARTRELLAAHGESVPEQPSLLEEPKAPRPTHDIEGDKAKVAAARSKPTPKRSREEIETMAAARRAGDKVPAKTASNNRTTKAANNQGSAGKSAKQTAATSQRAKPAAASKTAAAKSAKQTPARKAAAPAPASKGAKRATAQQPARPTAARKSAAQPAARKSAKQPATKKAAKQSAAPARKATSNKAGATKARATGRATAAQTRASSTNRRQR